MRRLFSIFFIICCIYPVRNADAVDVEADVLFARKIQPLFKVKCFTCHGDDPEKLKGDLDMRTRDGLLAGGESEKPSLVVGDAFSSPLYLAVTREHEDDWAAMPPKENDKLTSEQIRYIKQWINAGALWPDAKRIAVILKESNPWGEASGVRVKTSGGLDDSWTNRRYDPADLWSYQPVERPKLPSSSANPIDAFINAKLPEGLVPAPLADSATLIRRATFGLTGLPPSPDEIDMYLSESGPDVFKNLIDKLLASPHYGEQWGRHWLDVVRYADSSGFANDFERPNAWRYRDYVIRSFNNDKPYNQFVREQLAGDEINSNKIENKIAVGFLRMGPWEQTGMAVARVTRQFFLDDVTDSVGQVFLGHALQCARCHDHKFDPIPTRDYYSMQAIFANTQFAEVNAAFHPNENTDGFEVHKKYHQLRNDENKLMLEGLPKERVTPNDFGRERLGRKWNILFSWGFDRYLPIAYTVYNGKTRLDRNVNRRRFRPSDPMGKGVLEQSAILTGGDLFSPGEKVAPAILSAVGLKARIPEGFKGRRLALANWIVHKNNPLTARVMVNRVWQYHFGRGLVGNSNNFGATGKKPTHPELLDWLASEFVDKGWSLKQLHRIIMTSETYRRASAHPDIEKLSRLDSDGNSYAVFLPRRLAAEELRDAMLAVSGELNRKPGGIPARPDMNLEAALQPRMIMGTFAPSYIPDIKPEQRNRRSIYALKLRGQRDPFMTTFNQPGFDKSCELRDSSNVTPQVFSLFNSEESADRALAFSARILKETKNDMEAVRRAFRLAFGRVPDNSEVDAALQLWKVASKEQAERNPMPRTYPTEILRTANEENTGQTFTFREKLFEYRDYQPDLQPHQVDARTRGLADLCLALLNANEFLYVY
ncbi:MAG: PSD1 and planctomycete cytochrome C domain-containing protein [Verrucomicrobiota bacterium]|nr:PSD1 and planctomycete cytochrome C domain-containing protein [Verrucomicrobiota bacterium]